METENPIMLFKIITGELIIGMLNKELSQEDSDILFIENPAVISLISNSFYLTKFNHFSKLNTVMISGKNIVYVDLPDENILSVYQNLLKSKIPTTFLDDKGEEHFLH